MQVHNVPSDDDSQTTPIQRSIALHRRISNDAQKTHDVMRGLGERIESALVRTDEVNGDLPVAGATTKSALGRALSNLNVGMTNMVSLRCEMENELARLNEQDRRQELRTSAGQELRDITIQLDTWRAALGAWNRLPDMGVEVQFSYGRDVIVKAIERLELQQSHLRVTCVEYGVDLDALGLL